MKLDEFVIMPNHIHGIIEIFKTDDELSVGTGHCPVPTTHNIFSCGSKFSHVASKSLSTIVGSYKAVVTKTVKAEYPDACFSWQSRFYDRIIRNEKELNKIRQCIINNPAKWELDRNNPEDLFM